MSEEQKNDILSTVNRLLKRRPPSKWTVNLTIIFLTFMFACGAFLFFNKDFFLSWQETANDVAHLLEAHDKCKQELANVKIRIEHNEYEIAQLKERLSNK